MRNGSRPVPDKTGRGRDFREEKMKIRAAVIQMNSGSNREANLKQASRLVEKAVGGGARLAALPENFAYMRGEKDIFEVAEGFGGPTMNWARETARKHRIHLLAGTFGEKSPRENKVFNTSVLLDPEGEILGAYRKIHLFSADFPGDESHRETDRVLPGRSPVVADTTLGTMGLSVCYDLRFPGLYRKLVEMGARVIFVPSAFTRRTGKDHWEVLIRARAIENQVFMIAPGQVGKHPRGRETYGNSLIADPWGRILARVEKGEGVALADLDLEEQDRIRRSMPCLEHRVRYPEPEEGKGTGAGK